jgi:prepilin-type N-terminal cleavage/methylation domain-containing protein
MKSQQSGFTLVEIAIVLVIIGLLLGGVLKGQELINSAKVKSMATDFRNIQTALYGYQDRFKALPGDHNFGTNVPVTGMTLSTDTTIGNGRIDSVYNSMTNTSESCLMWQHLRLAGFFAGPTTVDCSAGAEYLPKNADGGRIGMSSTMQITTPTAMTGTFNICSEGVLGKFAKQLDTQLDDGNPQTGSFRVALTSAPTAAETIANIGDSVSTIVCLAF